MTTLAVLVQVLVGVESEEVATRQRIPVDTLEFHTDGLEPTSPLRCVLGRAVPCPSAGLKDRSVSDRFLL
jgi:hypothetical protein